MKFTDLFIRRPVLASVVSLLILVVGLRAIGALPVLQYPRTENAVVTVTTTYYGADPDVIAGFITTPLEQAIAQANGIDYMTSTSQSGVSTITVYLRLNYDSSKALTEINTKVSSVLNRLPAGTQQPVLTVQDRPDHRCDVHRLQQQGAGAQPDHRLPGARRAAQAAVGRGRADRRASGRQELRAARLARPAEARGLRPHRRRRGPGADQQRLHRGARHDQGPDGPGHAESLDGAELAQGVPQPRAEAAGRRDRAPERRRQRHPGLRRLRIRGELRRPEGGLYRHPGGAGRQPARRHQGRARRLSRRSRRSCRRD